MASILFVYPPTADPTGPYLSIPYLTAACRSRGHQAGVVDLNLAGYLDLLRAERLAGLADEARRRLQRLPQDGLTLPQAAEYLALSLAVHDADHVARHVEAAVQGLRDPAQFHDRARYDEIFQLLQRALGLVSARFHPLDLAFTRYGGPFHLNDAGEIAREAKADRNPFQPSYATHLVPAVAAFRPDVIGISATFNAQLQQTFAIGGFLKERFPGIPVIAGGTAVTQLVLRSSPADVAALAPFLDAIGLYEGEETLCDLLAGIDAGRGLADVPNVVRLGGAEAVYESRPSRVDLDAWPAPDYSDLPLDRYLSPEPVLYLAPTRGCYWEKCAFCHYGLTDHGTAPYRRRQVDRFVDDLATLAERHRTRFFYFAGDLIDPRYLFELADRILARGLDVRFTSDLRIERSFTRERCRKLRQAGLVAAAFGTESDSPRLLGLMEKGTDPKANREVFAAFAEAGIAVQAMTFIDFPTETADEAHATLDLLEENLDRIDLFFVEEFDLEAGSRVFREPARYGVQEVFYPAGDSYRLRARYVAERAWKSDEEYQDIVGRLDRLASLYGRRPYPFAGSVSVAHTIQWFERHGRDVFKQTAAARNAQNGCGNGHGHANGNGTADPRALLRAMPRLAEGLALCDLPYDLEMLADHVGEQAAELERKREMELRDVGREAFAALVVTVPRLPPRESYYLLPAFGSPVPIPDWVWRLVSCLDGNTTVREAAQATGTRDRDAGQAVRVLLQKGYLTLGPEVERPVAARGT